MEKKDTEPLFVPCAAKAVVFMIQQCLPNLDNKIAVVIGNTPLVGKPTADLLRKMNVNVTVCNRSTADVAKYTENADIVVVDIGSPRFLEGHWLKPGAVVIDAGMNVISGSQISLQKKTIIGDVDFESVINIDIIRSRH